MAGRGGACINDKLKLSYQKENTGLKKRCINLSLKYHGINSVTFQRESPEKHHHYANFLAATGQQALYAYLAHANHDNVPKSDIIQQTRQELANNHGNTDSIRKN